MKYSCYQESLVERCVACQSRKSDFGWHRFCFSPCLMRKRVQKSQVILALLDKAYSGTLTRPEIVRANASLDELRRDKAR